MPSAMTRQVWRKNISAQSQARIDQSGTATFGDANVSKALGMSVPEAESIRKI